MKLFIVLVLLLLIMFFIVKKEDNNKINLKNTKIKKRGRRTLKDYLIIINIGNNISFIEKCELFNKHRNYDICVNFWGNDENIKNNLYKNSDYFYQFKDGYLNNLYLILKDNFWLNYNYIGKMDDDLIINYNKINYLFNVSKKYNLDITQPSFKDNVNLVYKCFKDNPRKIFTYSNFIEIQFPIFKKIILKNTIFPLIKDFIINFNFKSGWGLDAVWSSVPNIKKAIIQGINCEHCKPVNPGHEDSYYKKFNIDPFFEAKTFCNKYNINCNIDKTSLTGWSKNSYYNLIHNSK